MYKDCYTLMRPIYIWVGKETFFRTKRVRISWPEHIFINFCCVLYDCGMIILLFYIRFKQRDLSSSGTFLLSPTGTEIWWFLNEFVSAVFKFFASNDSLFRQKILRIQNIQRNARWTLFRPVKRLVPPLTLPGPKTLFCEVVQCN